METDNRKWLDEKISISYREMFDIIRDYTNENIKKDEDEIMALSFKLIMDLFAKINGESPYKQVI